ncbi:hypothetical protein G6O67_000592 [Ophiocordyceps sinensis]|uniref:Uncharacterized protein n=1 Tax=Ophiocordyceps sinensis TaxID=72228 RepID=A0A8H4V9X6_9HYPO|nr:hypothetical protein G6O67_000592 [Ophiocordyceps sinensis]
MTAAAPAVPAAHSPSTEKQSFDLNLQHGHKDLVQAVAFNTYGDRCATGTVDGKIRVFNRHKDATWRMCDTWTAHGGEVLEVDTCALATPRGVCAGLEEQRLMGTVATHSSLAAMAPRNHIPQSRRLARHGGLVPPLGRGPLRRPRPPLLRRPLRQRPACL